MTRLMLSIKVLFLLVAHADAVRPSQVDTRSDFPIDAVYCWAGEVNVEVNNSDPTDHDAGEDFHELYYSLLSLEKNAEWIHRVFVLVNGPHISLPKWAARNGNVVMIDRCTLFPKTEAKFCPTFNTHACQSVVHRVPELSEHFLLLEDDFMAIHPTTQSDFFDHKKRPYNCYRPQDFHILYGTTPPSGPNMPPEKRPDTYDNWGNCHHTPHPMLVSFSRDLETEFSDWFAFVRSHKRRFTCCDSNIHDGGEPSLAEDFNWWYPAMMDRRSVSTHKEASENYVQCSESGAAENLQQLVTGPVRVVYSKFAVVNNCDTPEHAAAAFEVLKQHLGEPTGRFVVGGCPLNTTSVLARLLGNVSSLVRNSSRQ